MRATELLALYDLGGFMGGDAGDSEREEGRGIGFAAEVAELLSGRAGGRRDADVEEGGWVRGS